jgi:hypothetical protein
VSIRKKVEEGLKKVKTRENGGKGGEDVHLFAQVVAASARLEFLRQSVYE